MFIDTETNGLPPKYLYQITDMPRIVQLSWIIADEDGNIEKKCGYLIKPVDFEIPDDAVNVHGITKEKALRDGVDIKEAISLFMTDLNNCNAIAGHNVSFDIQVLRGELERLKIANAIHDMPYYCTMHLSVDYCKIPTQAAYIRSFSQYISYSLNHPREYKYKYPKLIELYDFLFDDRFDNAHDANADVDATVKCFFELVKRKVVTYKSTDRTYGEIISSLEKWTITDSRPFAPEEIAAVDRAEVVESQYGNSVCFFMKGGGQTYIPLSEQSKLAVGDELDLKTAKLITLSRKGNNDICRVIE